MLYLITPHILQEYCPCPYFLLFLPFHSPIYLLLTSCRVFVGVGDVLKYERRVVDRLGVWVYNSNDSSFKAYDWL